jgi:hypothetical protein
MHTAGFCKFGDRCRNHHTGDPGSDVARKAYSDFLKANPKGSESAKGSGKQPGKGKNKNDGKGKKGDTKGTKGGSTAPAAAAAASSTVTITEVEGKQVQKAWQSFCQFCDMFLKLSIPVLATLISSITNSYEQIGRKQRLQWFTLRFRTLRSTHWSSWGTLVLPMTLEVSGHCKTKV